MNAVAALVVATHPEHCRTLVQCFESLGLKPALAFTVDDARRALQSSDVALVCCAPEFTDGTYREVLQEAQQRRLPLVLLLRRDDWRDYIEAMDHGVFDCLAFPCSPAEIERIVEKAIGIRRGKDQRAASA